MIKAGCLLMCPPGSLWFYRFLPFFWQSLPTICLTVCAALLLEQNCTLPLLSFHSSHPTLCTGCGWSYRPCLATHSIITLFSSYHHALASYLTSHTPYPFVSCTYQAACSYVYIIIRAICICIKCVASSQRCCQVFDTHMFFFSPINLPCL